MPIHTPPDIAKILLKDNYLTTSPPMSIRAAKTFKQYDSFKIRQAIAPKEKQNSSAYRRCNTPSSRYDNNSNLELLIDDKFLVANKGILLRKCNNFTINGNSNLLHLINSNEFFISLIDCHSFTIEGITIKGGYNTIILTNCFQFTLSKCKSQNSDGFGLIIHNCKQFTIKDCIYQNTRSGIMVLGQSSHGAITNCKCLDCKGCFNCDAGIHLCATSPDIGLEQIPHKCHEPVSIEAKTCRPHQILIEECTLSNCRAQGLYLEGAVNCLIQNNNFRSNNKEGVCFDWGSCYNIFTDNTVSLNGERKELTEEDIVADFIADYPLLENGSSSMKLPGISLDNGSMNLIEENKITNNFGGGIKMVRSAMFNTVNNNFIVNNAIGTNKFTPFYHGISALGIGCINNEFSQNEDTLLDFLPSVKNKITNNTIKNHYLSIFCDPVSKDNFISHNSCSHECGSVGKLKTIFFKVQSKIIRIIASYLYHLQPSQGLEKSSQTLNFLNIESQNLSRRLSRLLLCQFMQKFPGNNWNYLRFYPHSVPTDALLKRWQKSEWPDYQKWIDKNSILSQRKWLQLHRETLVWRDSPRITIVTPVYNTEAETLRTCILSVLIQTTPFWELILIDDNSSKQETLQVLNSSICHDPRIHIVPPNEKKATGISAATNRGIDAATGDFIIFLDHDDRLAPEAIQSICSALQKDPKLDILYSDRDMISETNKRFMYLMKPDWSPENLYSANYIFHLMCYRKQLLQDVGKMRSEYDGGQDHDLILRCMEHTSRIRHIPEVLYHYRSHEESMATNEEAKSYAYVAGIKAIEDALRRRKIVATVSELDSAWRGNYQIRLEPCLTEQTSIIKLKHDDAPEQYTQNILNNPELQKETDPFLFIQHEGYQEINAQSMEIMASWLQLDKIGMVSGALLDPNNNFAYAGLTYSNDGQTILPYFGYPLAEPGYLAVTKTLRNISGPNPYSVIIRRELWEQLGGLNTKYKGWYSLLDFALRSLEANWRIVYNPQAMFQSSRNISQETPIAQDQLLFRKCWAKWLQQGDPYYSPNLSKKSDHYELDSSSI